MEKKKNFNIMNAIIIAGAILVSFLVIDYANESLGILGSRPLIIGMAIAVILAGAGVFLVAYRSKRSNKKNNKKSLD
jgi:hypothetical protein